MLHRCFSLRINGIGQRSLTMASDLTRQVASQISELSSLVQQSNLDRETQRTGKYGELI